MKTNAKEFISAAIIGFIVYEAGVKICNWLDRRKRKRKIIENIKDEDEFNNFAAEEMDEVVNLKDLDKYSDERLKRILELTYYFNICKGVKNIVDILKKSQEKKGEK